MNEEKISFLERIKKLPLEELLKYETAAVQAGRIIDVIGISLILLMLFFPMEMVILVGVLGVMLLANMGAGIHKSLLVIRQHLQDPKRVDK